MQETHDTEQERSKMTTRIVETVDLHYPEQTQLPSAFEKD